MEASPGEGTIRNEKALGKGALLLFLLALLCFVAFAYLTLRVNVGSTQAVDEELARRIYELRSPGLNTLLEGITYLGNWQSIVCLCLVLLALPATRRTYGIPVAAAAIVSNLIKAVVKLLVERPRPDAANALISEGGWSFPSGHAITAMAVFLLLAMLLWRNGRHILLLLLCVVLAFAIGCSRIYLGVHYPCDVLAGWLGGMGTAFLALLLMERLAKDKKKTYNNEL